MANLTTCMVCGKKYNYCPSCSRTHAWQFYTDTRQHYQIYMIIEELNAKVFTIGEAKIALENIGITADTDLSEFKPSVADQINKIVNHKEVELIKTNKKKNNSND